MQAKKQIKLEDLFTVRFTEKSANISKDSDDQWLWGNVPNYPNYTIFIRRTVKTKDGDRLVTRQDLVPMAIVTTPELTDIDTYSDNWIKLGYTKSDKAKAKSSLEKFIASELKREGLTYMLDNGYFDKTTVIEYKFNQFLQVGVTEDSARKYFGTVLSPESRLLGKKFTSYYDVPDLEYKALSAASDNTESSDNSVVSNDTQSSDSESPSLRDRTNLEAMTKTELLDYAASLNISVSKSLGKQNLIDAILQAIG